ncbi:Iron-chelator utilization protein [Leucobacter sp. 7(1)]|uniref:siderophore-interacting protein n=1 Tax=Leucobacter sp. 7(1) TaxID=1255613 RepID=UPI00097E94B1|nr:siderophore-interacting protein [Leucobacter sp. 7(1)]SJN11267.1 Iron-chelator utilization protein [Leucobacter sp. 7(1)]
MNAATARNLRAGIRELTRAAPAPVIVSATLTGLEQIAPSYTRITLTAAGLQAYSPTLPADAVKIAVPSPAGGTALRAMTVALRPNPTSLCIDVLRHSDGIIDPWLASARVGDTVEVYAVRREFVLGAGIDAHLIIADATALPAAASILRSIPPDHAVRLILQVPDPHDAPALLTEPPGARLTLHTGARWNEPRLRAQLDAWADHASWTSTQAWVAAEAGVVSIVRKSLVERGQPRDQLFAAAYWKAGRDSGTRDARIRAAFAATGLGPEDLADPTVRTEIEQRADRA